MLLVKMQDKSSNPIRISLLAPKTAVPKTNAHPDLLQKKEMTKRNSPMTDLQAFLGPTKFRATQ
jgi:hypothetical protein